MKSTCLPRLGSLLVSGLRPDLVPRLKSAQAARTLALAAALGMCFSNQAQAAGLIMVDPGFAPIRPMHVVRPGIGIGRPPVMPQPPISTTPVLRGGVTFGLRLESQDIKVEIND